MEQALRPPEISIELDLPTMNTFSVAGAWTDVFQIIYAEFEEFLRIRHASERPSDVFGLPPHNSFAVSALNTLLAARGVFRDVSPSGLSSAYIQVSAGKILTSPYESIRAMTAFVIDSPMLIDAHLPFIGKVKALKVSISDQHDVLFNPRMPNGFTVTDGDVTIYDHFSNAEGKENFFRGWLFYMKLIHWRREVLRDTRPGLPGVSYNDIKDLDVSAISPRIYHTTDVNVGYRFHWIVYELHVNGTAFPIVLSLDDVAYTAGLKYNRILEDSYTDPDVVPDLPPADMPLKPLPNQEGVPNIVPDKDKLPYDPRIECDIPSSLITFPDWSLAEFVRAYNSYDKLRGGHGNLKEDMSYTDVAAFKFELHIPEAPGPNGSILDEYIFIQDKQDYFPSFVIGKDCAGRTLFSVKGKTGWYTEDEFIASFTYELISEKVNYDEVVYMRDKMTNGNPTHLPIWPIIASGSSKTVGAYVNTSSSSV